MSDECITIESSEDDGIQVMEPPIKSASIKDEGVTQQKTEFESPVSGGSAFAEFLRKCKESKSADDDMDTAIKKMRKGFRAADEAFTSSLYFIHLIEKLSHGVNEGPYIQMKNLLEELKCHTIVNIKKRRIDRGDFSTSNEPSEENQLDSRTVAHIRKLEKVVEKLHRKIAHLEVQEVDSSEDEDSAYIQVAKYKERICQVFKKICELRRTYSGTNPLRANIKFSGTRLPAVNRAIEKFYNDQREFPDFHDVLTVVQKVNSSKSLNLSPGECHNIAEQSFTELGETLKKQRQFDFQETLDSYIPENAEDPAAEDADLKLKLDYNKKQYGNRIDEIIDKYAQKQKDENLEPVEVPSDALVESGEEEESNDNVTSLSEPETDKDLNEEAIEVSDVETIEVVPPFRDCKIMLTNVTLMPEWEKYRSKIKKISDENYDSDENTGTHVCEPVPGCSKSTSTDFCEKCSDRNSRFDSSSRKRSISSDSDSESSSSKKRRYNAYSVNPKGKDNGNKRNMTDTTDTFVIPVISSVTSMSSLASAFAPQVSVTSDGEHKRSSNNAGMLNLSTAESESGIEGKRSSRDKKFDVVNDVKETTSMTENDADVISIEDFTDVSQQTEVAFVSVKDFPSNENVENVDGNEDEIMIIDEMRNDEESSNHVENGRNADGIPSKDIIDVENLEGKSNNDQRFVSRRLKNNDKGKLEIIDIEKIDSRKKVKQDDIIDVERLPDETVKVNGFPMPNLSQVIRNMKFPFSDSGENSVSLTPVRPNIETSNHTRGAPSYFGNRDSSRISHYVRPRYPITSSPKPFFNQRTNATAFVRHQNNANMNMQRRRTVSSNNHSPILNVANRRSEMHRSFRPPFGGNRNTQQQQHSFNHQNHQQLPHSSAMQKRTTQTTEHKVIKNNIITRTTTVVEESVLRVDSNNCQAGRFMMGQNGRFVMQGRYTARKQTQQIQRLRRTDTKSNSSGDDVITLD